ncbi:MAG: TIGR02710 family CRISPR-associated CARF protein [Eubacteriales bacterium]|nr:TIGR02710 family CRISPR-associated CARF protein [Eubacteriales bacterium]
MNKKLQKMTQEWMQLERKTLEQRHQADEFYETNLMGLIEEDYVKRNKKKVYEPVEYLVMSVGTSYEPIILNIKLFKPRRILFLYTEKSIHTLNKIVKYCEMTPDSYEKSKISETEPLGIYKEIKRSYLEWNKPEKMYIDFTGGTKAMSVAAAMAGAMINVQLVYVGTNDYLTDFRKPNPGTEILSYISNPLAVFGDLEIEKALILFSEHNYAGAQEKLKTLKEEIPDPNIRQQLNFVYLLARVYEAWDALEFTAAYDYISILNRQLKRDRITHGTFLLMDFYETLQKQEKILQNLQQIPGLIQERKNIDILTDLDAMTALMFTMFQSALTREEQEKYDMATLLLYRLLEMIEQRRLALYGLYVSKMNYMALKYNAKQCPEYGGLSTQEQFALLKNKVHAIKGKLFKSDTGDYLPEQVSLLEGFIILHALGDPVVCNEGNQGINELKRIRSMVFLRNNSIFAHGLGPVSQEDFRKFKQFVHEFLNRFCKIEGIEYEKYCQDVRWLNPLESRNYAVRMEE